MTTLSVSGMTCMKCVARVETALKGFDPAAAVTLKPPRATLAAAVPLAGLNAALGGKYVLAEAGAGAPAWLVTYYPLFLILALIGLASLAAADWMMAFMAGFFIIFGAFKSLDVPAFANAYARYDVVAQAWRPWGYIYPFVELALGFAYLFHWMMTPVVWATLIVSLVGAIGVVRSVIAKETIQCACLGTVFKLPMSTVTIIENLGMAAMAAWMLAA